MVDELSSEYQLDEDEPDPTAESNGEQQRNANVQSSVR